jgi:hypothetical protein
VKLDKELVREILLKIEADTGDPMDWRDLSSLDWDREQVVYTVCLLSEGRLIEAENLGSHDGNDWRATRLTFAGHEYLETVRDAEIWRKTKEVAGKAGVYSLQALMEAGKMIAKLELAKHGVHLG